MRLNSAFVILLLTGIATGVHAAEFRLLSLDGVKVKWGAPTLGEGATVTYSFVKSDHAYDDAINCKKLAPFPKALEHSRVTREEFEAEFHHAFRLWQASANVSFQFVEDPASANIIIGVQAEPRAIAFANVWHVETENQPIGRLTKAAICLNPELNWEAAFDGDRQTYSIRQIAAHEIGHAIGLDHPGRTGQLMGYRYSESDEGLRSGDVLGAITLYGPKTR